MRLACPLCNRRLPRFPWAFTEQGSAIISCDCCASTISACRRWRRRTVTAWSLAVLVPVWLVLLRGITPRSHFYAPSSQDSWLMLLGILAILTAFVAIHIWLVPYRVSLISAGTLCHRCGYDRQGLPHNRCPECGHTHPAPPTLNS